MLKGFFSTGIIQEVIWLTNILLVSVVASLIEWNVAAPDHVDEAHRHPVTVGQEVFVVLLPHAVADPRAMVVKTRHALVTHRAVLRPGKKQAWNLNFISNWNKDRIIHLSASIFSSIPIFRGPLIEFSKIFEEPSSNFEFSYFAWRESHFSIISFRQMAYS